MFYRILKSFFILGLLMTSTAEAKEAEATITINGVMGEITLNKNTPAKIELHLAGNDDTNKSADYYVMAFIPDNKTCGTSEVGLEHEVCGFIYKSGTNTWSNVPFGTSLTGHVFSFDNFTLLESTLPVGTYEISFFVVDNLKLSLISGDEITLNITE